MLVSYEETREQVLRNARGWGHDLAAYEEQGLLQIVAVYPEVASLDDHLVALKDLIERFSRPGWRSTACRRSSGSAARRRTATPACASGSRFTTVSGIVTGANP